MINETDYTDNPLTKEQEVQIDALFNQFDTTDKPGCSIGVIQNGRFIYKKSFGMANLDNDIPINSKSKFKIGSVTKEFTASCIALLVLEGKLNIDDKVRKYIPQLPDYGSSISIQHLLNHTSGLRDYMCLLGHAEFDFDRSFNNEDCKKILYKQKRLNFEPGEIFCYSNSGYLLLADIVHLITGKSLKEYADERIFKPLGMNDTFYISDINKVIKNKVIPYKINDSGISYFIHNIQPIGAGGIYSTLDDFIKWDNNFKEPIVGGKEFLELIQKKGYLNNIKGLENYGIEDYDMGFMHGTYNGRKWTGHEGGYFGFNAIHMRFPEFKTSVIIMANREDAELHNKSTQITDILYKSTTPSVVITDSEESKLVEFNLSPLVLEKFCGYYWCEKSRLNRKIYLKEGQLFYWREENNESRLVPVRSNELIMADMPVEVKLIFNFDCNQKTIKIFENGKLTSEFISYEPLVFDKEYLRGFTGKYYSDEIEVLHEIKLDPEGLVLYKNNIKISDIKGIVSGSFEIPEWGSFINFLYDDNKNVSGFLFHEERIKRLEFIKIE